MPANRVYVFDAIALTRLLNRTGTEAFALGLLVGLGFAAIVGVGGAIVLWMAG